MAFFKDPMSHGNLFVKFDVDFPKKGQLTEEQLEGLKKILPGPQHDLKKVKNFEYLEDFDEHDTNPNPEGGKTKDEEEEDIGGQGTRVQCGQQ